MNPLSSSVPWKYFALGLALALVAFVVLLFLNNASKFIYINF